MVSSSMGVSFASVDFFDFFICRFDASKSRICFYLLVGRGGGGGVALRPSRTFFTRRSRFGFP